MSKNLAIIPVRLGSKKTTKKKYKEFGGKPLFLHTLEHAIHSGLFDEIHVSTESNEVVDICSKAGIAPRFMRPKKLADDDAKLQMVFDFVIKKYEEQGLNYDKFCILWATAPLRTSEDIIESHNMITNEAEVVIVVTYYDYLYFVLKK